MKKHFARFYYSGTLVAETTDKAINAWAAFDAADQWLTRLRRWLPDDAPVRG